MRGERNGSSIAETSEGDIKMLRKLIFAAGASYLWRKFTGSGRRSSGYSRNGLGSLLSGSRSE